ncbi:uncharacterized protein LOC115210785 isoform X2 [Octopus sinensis]|uniref:Uncharacterized protein LOC115210785 isoform X2 n=1 Tax=Octopus sinensis TaxID=2607531 RepID=A0A6P7SBF1_9MOLL|nr:uncharacterized protein LOC115210785 isoform X2 [Octopus sinensis]
MVLCSLLVCDTLGSQFTVSRLKEPKYHGETIKNVTETTQKFDKPKIIAVAQDTKGPEIRTGLLKGYHGETIKNVTETTQKFDKPKIIAVAQDTKGPEIRTGLLKGDNLRSSEETFTAIYSNLSIDTANLSNDITVLTAYFNIGAFAKGSVRIKFTPSNYYEWMSAYGKMRNNLVVYTDDERTYKTFQKLRGNVFKEQTKLFFINKTELLSFRIEKNISDIFKQQGYPKHLPNTVIPEYSCAMHAKYELLNRIIRKNFFHTKYFMWSDIGLFRTPQNSLFKFALPKNFDDTKVAFSRVYGFNRNSAYKDIIYNNAVWLAGGCSLGKYDVLLKFTQEYFNFLHEALSMKLVSTDQQIIYGMYVDKQKPVTKLQLYESGWYALSNTCYEAGKALI